MIVLSEVAQPTDGVRISQPQVQVYFDNDSAGDGTLTVAESCVTWLNRQTQKGFSLSYQSIILHAISTDTSSFPHECVYVLVDCSKAERRGRRNIPLYTAAEAAHVNDLNMANDELANDGDADDADSNDAPNVAIRFVPTDTSVLQQIYDEMGACQALNPDEGDVSDEEGDDEMHEIMEGAEGMEGGRWFTAESMGEMGSGDFELSEEGMANLQRMMGGGSGSGQNGHHDPSGGDGDHQMDEE